MLLDYMKHASKSFSRFGFKAWRWLRDLNHFNEWLDYFEAEKTAEDMCVKISPFMVCSITLLSSMHEFQLYETAPSLDSLELCNVGRNALGT